MSDAMEVERMEVENPPVPPPSGGRVAQTTAAPVLTATNSRSSQAAHKKPFPCEQCDMSFVSKAKLSYHVIRTHTAQRSPSPSETGVDAALNIDSSLIRDDQGATASRGSLRLAVTRDPASSAGRMDVDKGSLAAMTPNPLQLLSAMEKMNQPNIFSKYFCSHNAKSAQGDDPMSSTGRELNPILFGSQLSSSSPVPLSALMPTFVVGPLANPWLYLNSPTPTISLPPAPPSAGFSDVPVFSLFPSAAALPPPPPDKPVGTVMSPPQTNSVTSTTSTSAISPPEPSPSPPVVGERRLQSQELSPGRFNELTIDEAVADGQGADDMSETMSIHSDDSSLPAHRNGSMEPAGPTAPRKTRPILETDDPLLADKRRRNRIAAEKCRKRRKEKQEGLEVSNQTLKNKYTELQKEFRALQQSSKARIQQLTEENKAFKQENILLRTQLNQFSFLQQQQPLPVPVPAPQVTATPPSIFAFTQNGQRLQLFLQPGPVGNAQGAPAAGFAAQ